MERMRRLVLVPVVFALGGILAAPATPSRQAPHLTCKYGFKYVTKIVHGHKKRVKVCKKKPLPKPQADLHLTLSATLEQVTAGNHVAYSVVVENKGPAVATNLTLSVDLPPGDAELNGSGGSVEPDCNLTKQQSSNHLECRFSELAPESDTESGISSYEAMRMLLEPDTPGDFAASAKITFGAQTVDPHPADDAATKPLRVLAGPATADLDVGVSSSPIPASVPEGFTETVSVTNHGPTEATDVYVTLLLPQGATALPEIPFDIENLLFSASLCGFYPYGLLSTAIVCFDSVGSGETRTETLDIAPSIRSPATLRTDAVVSSYTRDLNLGDNRTTTETPLEPFTPAPGPDVRVAFGHLQDFSAGKAISIPFRLSNLGLGDVRSPTVTASIDPPLQTLGFGVSAEGDIECNESSAGTAECKFGGLPSDAHLVGTLYSESVPAGSYTATVTVTSPDLAAPVTATTTFQVK
jgi:uncharacterized repeat protein (TIGR01451 family)